MKAESTILYGVVEWLNGEPLLDGMKYFMTRNNAIQWADRQEKFYEGASFKTAFTIISLEKGIEHTVNKEVKADR